MKSNIIAEVGINHFGKVRILNEYINKFSNKGVDGISIQILNKNKTADKFKNYTLKKIEIKNFILKAKKNFKLVGVAIHSWDDFKFLSNLNINFIKILSSSFGDYKYYENVKSTGIKKIYLATGNKTIKDISLFLKKINVKKLTLIHTFFKTKNFDKSIKKILVMKKKFKKPIAYGNHFNKVEQIYKVCKYKPSDIFFYIKMNNKHKYPDDTHAVSLRKISSIMKKIRNDSI